MKIITRDMIADEPISHNPAILKKVFIRNSEIPRLTNFTQSRFPIGESAPAHAHTDMYEVFFVESGNGLFRIDGQDFFVSAGSCVRVDLNEMHEIVNTGSEELVLTYFGIEV